MSRDIVRVLYGRVMALIVVDLVLLIVGGECVGSRTRAFVVLLTFKYCLWWMEKNGSILTPYRIVVVVVYGGT